MTDAAGRGRQVRSEIAHWRLAAEALGNLDDAAAPEAWAGLEAYLQRGIRDRLTAVVETLVQEARALERQAAAGRSDDVVRAGVLALRTRYLQAEVIIDFYCDAVNSRTTPALSQLLRGLDAIAGDSMSATLTPLGIESPPALIYVDKGLGASILRAGVRLWDQAHPSPAAAIKLTRHNLGYPTAALHETGHQVAHLTGWTAELGDALHAIFAGRSSTLAEMWRSWASEVAADAHAFAQAGAAPLFALANVVDGPTAEVLRVRFGDPHPFSWIRVIFNVALCRSWYGAGRWDDVAQAWWDRHPPGTAGPAIEQFARSSIAAMDEIVDVCTRRPMRAFRGQPLCNVLDPRQLHPVALRQLEEQAGGTLLTSSYLRRRHSLRVLALLSLRSVLDPGHATAHQAQLITWISALGTDATPRPELVVRVA
ncbi:MAG TPA: hypothetical protein VFU35_06755 [Jatrophihabitans sp.]|nr:hypothetical protein [Jatrophihabitans sp.]